MEKSLNNNYIITCGYFMLDILRRRGIYVWKAMKYNLMYMVYGLIVPNNLHQYTVNSYSRGEIMLKPFNIKITLLSPYDILICGYFMSEVLRGRGVQFLFCPPPSPAPLPVLLVWTFSHEKRFIQELELLPKYDF